MLRRGTVRDNFETPPAEHGRGEARLARLSSIRRNRRGVRLPLEGKLAQRQLRLMRSKLKIITMGWYKIATFDLIRSGLSRTTVVEV